MSFNAENENQENADNSENTIQARPFDDLIKSTEQKMLADADEPLKRKRGRPRKVAAEVIPPAAEPAQVAPMREPTDYRTMIQDLAAMGSGMLQDRLGTPAAALTHEEQERLAIGLNPLLQKWFPDMEESLSPELTAVICCGTVAFAVWTRVQADRRAQAAKTPSAPAEPAQVEQGNAFPWAPPAGT